MTQLIREESNYQCILFSIVEILTAHAKNEWPSPTIKQLSYRTGYSEEIILESLEFGTLESDFLLH